MLLLFGTGCTFLAEQVTDESYDRAPEMERLRARVIEAVGLEAPPDEDAPSLGAAGGNPDIDGSQRWVSATGRLDGELPQAGDRVIEDLTGAGFSILDHAPLHTKSSTVERIVRATDGDMVVKVELFDSGNPAALPAEDGTVYADIRVALRDSVGLTWTHVD